MGVDIEEEQLSFLQAGVHALQGAFATQPAELPDQVGLSSHIEHHLGAAQSAQRAARQRLVAEDFACAGDHDWMVVHVDTAIADGRLEVVHAAGAFPLFERPRGVLRLADAAIDHALEPDLGIVVEVCASHVDVEQRGNVLAVRGLDLRRDVPLEARHHLGNFAVRRRRHAAGGNVEEDEVVVVAEAHHQARLTKVVVVQEVAHGARCRLQHRIELFPPVDLLDLRVADEIEVEHDKLAAFLEQRPRALDHHWQGGQARE